MTVVEIGLKRPSVFSWAVDLCGPFGIFSAHSLKLTAGFVSLHRAEASSLWRVPEVVSVPANQSWRIATL